MDVWYVDHRSLRLDGKIILRTIGKVLARAGNAFEEIEIVSIEEVKKRDERTY
jgi:hypothetical protein